MSSIPPPPTIPGAPTPRRGKSYWLGAGIVAAGMIVSCCAGFFAGAAGEPDPKVVSSPSPYAVTTVVTVEPSPAAVTPTSAAPAPTKAAAATVEDGIWTVGDDFPAGTYKVRDALTEMCYWGIYKSGTNQSDIVDNDIVTGGKPTVTLKRGQDFKSSGCGTWVKVK